MDESSSGLFPAESHHSQLLDLQRFIKDRSIMINLAAIIRVNEKTFRTCGDLYHMGDYCTVNFLQCKGGWVGQTFCPAKILGDSV